LDRLKKKRCRICSLKKNDVEYVANINKNQRERYRIRKLQKMEKKLNDKKNDENNTDFLDEKNSEKTIV
jgi:hypothetical protein